MRSVALHVFYYAGGTSGRCLVQLVEHHNASSCLIDGDHGYWTSNAHRCGGDGHADG